MLFEVLQVHISEQAAELSEVVALRLPAEERFSRFVGAFVDRGVQSRNQHLVLMHDLKFLPAAKRKQIRALEIRLVDLMVGLLKEINPKLMAPVEVQGPYALLLFGMVIWTAIWYQKSGNISPRELADRISDLFIEGFKRAKYSNREQLQGRRA